MAQKDYVPGSDLARLLDPIKLMQASNMMRNQRFQQAYLDLAEDRQETSVLNSAINAYKTGYKDTADILDDLWKIDDTGGALSSYVTSDAGKARLSQYSGLSPYVSWGENYKANQESMSNMVNSIITNTELDDVTRFNELDAMKSVYPNMGKFKTQYDTIHGQFKTARDRSIVNKFLDNALESGIFPAQKIMRLKATNTMNPTEALKEINEYDVTKRTDTVLDQWQKAAAIATNPLKAQMDKPAVDAARAVMRATEKELKALGFDMGDGDSPLDTSGLTDKALLSIHKNNPTWFITDSDGNITGIAEGKKDTVQNALANQILATKNESEVSKRLAATEKKVDLASKAGVVLPGSKEWEKLYGADASPTDVKTAGPTLDEGKGEKSVAVTEPVVKKLPPAKPGEPGRLPELKFMRYNQSGLPVFSTSGEPTGTTFPKELQQYRGSYTTEEQGKFRKISDSLRADREIYNKILEELDNIQNLKNKKSELDSSYSGYEKALKYYEDQIALKTKKKVDPLKARLSAPEYYDQVIASLRQ